MIISRITRTIIIILHVVLFVGTDTHFSYFIIRVYISKHSQPCSSSSLTILLYRQPSIFHSHNKCVSKHSRARCFYPAVRFIYQLSPHPLFCLIIFQTCHHTLETSYNRQMIWARFRQIAKHFCHPCRHPSVSSSPKIGYIRCMIEKSIRTLQLIQIHRHFFSSALNVFQFTGHFISMRLDDRNHIHVVNPQASLPTISLRCP